MTVHVVSDVHGEDVKLRQVINNASGILRPFVESIFRGDALAGRADRAPRSCLLPARDAGPRTAATVTVVFVDARAHDHPRAREALHDRVRRADHPGSARSGAARADVRARARRARLRSSTRCSTPFVRHGKEPRARPASSRAIVRNLAVGELVVAGDLGDRGPRLDKVIDLLDAAAERRDHLGQPRRRLDGGVPRPTRGGRDGGAALAALSAARAARGGLRHPARAAREARARARTATIRASAFTSRASRCDAIRCYRADAEGDRDHPVQARGRSCSGATRVGLEHRALLHRIDPAAGTIDARRQDAIRCSTRGFPTIDWADPYALTADEASVHRRARPESFIEQRRRCGSRWRSSRAAARCGCAAIAARSSTAACRSTTQGDVPAVRRRRRARSGQGAVRRARRRGPARVPRAARWPTST